MSTAHRSIFSRIADAVSLGGYSARLTENESRRAEAQANASYYTQANFAISSMPGLRPASGGTPNRTDTPYAIGDFDFGNLRFQDTYEIAWERWRSRQLEQTNWLARATMDRAIERTIGTLIRIEPRTDNEPFNDEVRAWLEGYWYTTLCDIRNSFTLSEMYHLLMRGEMRDGDCGLILTEDQNRNPKLQLIEAQRIKSPTTAEGKSKILEGNQVVDGIEMDPNGRPVAFFISTRPPGLAETFERVEARDFIFQFNTTRYSSVRGEPAFRGGYNLFDQIAGGLDSVIMAWRVGASQAMIAKKKNPGTAQSPNLPGLRPNLSVGSASTGQQQQLLPITPGMINVIGLEDELTAFNPTQPQQNFPASITMFARFISMRFGLCVEDVLSDYTQFTYSASKGAKSATQRATAIKLENFARNVVSRSYQWALSKAVKNGQFKNQAPDQFWKHEWLPPRWDSMEPLKDASARAISIALGIECRSNAAAEDGYDFKKLCQQNQKDNQAMTDANLPTAIPNVNVQQQGDGGAAANQSKGSTSGQ